MGDGVGCGSCWAEGCGVLGGNDDAIAGLVIHKRHGVADPGQQWVTCTVNNLIALLTGQRPEKS